MQAQTVMDSPLGKVWIVAAGEFISRIQFLQAGDFVPESRPSHLTNRAVKQLQEYFSEKRFVFDLPMSQHGSEFQKRVWCELTRIPFGETISYLDLSRRLGNEKAIRAAAFANGKNDLVILVPCHRVIGSDGKLVGYAGGLWRKKWLLNHERKMIGASVQQSLF